MAQGVVEALEPVNVDHEQAEWPIGFAGGVPGAEEVLIEEAAVGQAGECVGVRELLELAIGPGELLHVQTVAFGEQEAASVAAFTVPTDAKGDECKDDHGSVHVAVLDGG